MQHVKLKHLFVCSYFKNVIHRFYKMQSLERKTEFVNLVQYSYHYFKKNNVWLMKFAGSFYKSLRMKLLMRVLNLIYPTKRKLQSRNQLFKISSISQRCFSGKDVKAVARDKLITSSTSVEDCLKTRWSKFLCQTLIIIIWGKIIIIFYRQRGREVKAPT